ncbi:hypothetical protein [Larkinella punicea]|uniref:Uncharacterized protein n=1 Tax=Larkinella punicea TaxID=2315727 RepID=A0A368JSZ7_9BACT|nr:hypothetical protein [Larkinella punicea]RCR70086.1 hypothetical protein DUE52_09440 [Larkinella punicea]
MQATLSPPVIRTKIPTYIYAVVFSSLCIVWGLLWDIMWHMSIGRDGLFAPPHLLMYIGAVVAGAFSGFKILQLTFAKRNPERTSSVRFWGIFYGSLGAMYCVWGALTMLTSAPFDDWWHNTYGLDVQILTPPHTVLLIGMMTVQFGAMIGVLALQNRVTNGLLSDSEWNKKQAQRLKIMFTIAAGLLLSILYTMLAEKLGQWASHHSSSYITIGIAFPFYLLAVGRASSLRYPITLTAAAYMLTMLIPSWILPFFPATPRLGPVLNPITHYQAFMFPLLLVIPGFVLDKLLHRFGSGKLNDWLLAALTGTVFMLVITVVQWYFGEFLHTSPYAQNGFFFSDSMSYGEDPTWPYHHQFHPHWLQSTPDFLKGIGIAILCAIGSARVGLLWGNWMKRVQR